MPYLQKGLRRAVRARNRQTLDTPVGKDEHRSQAIHGAEEDGPGSTEYLLVEFEMERRARLDADEGSNKCVNKKKKT